jgi:hypothetical protein
MSDFTVQSYSPKDVIVKVGTHTVRGFEDGDMVVAEYANDEVEVHFGADGNARFIDLLARNGTITIRLSDYSPSNAALQLIKDANQPVPIVVVDKSSKSDVFFAAQCKCQKQPAWGKGKQARANEWPFLFLNGKLKATGGKETIL